MFRILATVLTLVALLVAAGCGGGAKTEAKADSAPPLPDDVKGVASITAPAAEPSSAAASAVTNLSLSATGEFRSPSESALAPKYAGRVHRVLVDEGAAVRAGQPLLELETQYTRLDIQRMEAEVARARAAAAEAQRELDRKTALRANESIPQSLLDRTESAAEQSRAAVRSAEVALAMTRQRLADAVLRSPMNGVVAARQVDVGEFLGDGGVAFVVQQTAPLKLRFQLPEKHIATVRRGQTVRAAVDPYPGETFQGTVATVGQVVDPATRTFFVEAQFANQDGRLRPGLFARVELETESETRD